MNVSYQNNKYNIELEDIKEHIKAIFELIQKPSKYVINKLKNERDNSIEFDESEIEHIRDQISKLYQKMDLIASQLKKNDLFYDEYFDFCEIEDMIKFTLNRNLSAISESDLNFISELIKDFYNLIDSKVRLVENAIFEENNFKTRYDTYLSDFNKSKRYFYKNIFDEKLDEDLFIKYCNLIME